MKSRLPKGMGAGGAQNMNQMIRQAQKMQEQITQVQEDIESQDFTRSVGGGAVELVMTGKKVIKSLTIKPEVVNAEDIEMLQDLIISAVNETVAHIDSVTEEEVGKVTGGVSIPGMF